MHCYLVSAGLEGMLEGRECTHGLSVQVKTCEKPQLLTCVSAWARLCAIVKVFRFQVRITASVVHVLRIAHAIPCTMTLR